MILTHGALLFLCCSITFGCYLGSYIRLPLVPLFARSLGADTFLVGLIGSAFLLVAGILSLPLGLLSDRIGRRTLILGGIVISSVSSCLLCLASTPYQLMAIFLFFGTGLAAFAPTMMSFVADFTPVTHLGRTYGWYTMALYSAMSLGPAAGGVIGHEFGFKTTFLASGIFVFCVFLISFFALPKGFKAITRHKSERSPGTIARELMRNRRVLACWLATLGGCFALGTFITFLPLYATDCGLDLRAIGIVFAAQAFVNALSRIPFGRMTDVAKEKSPIVAVGSIGFSIVIAGFSMAKGLTGFVLLSAGLGLCMAFSFTALGAMIPELVPHDSRGLAMGGYNACIYLGMMLGSAGMGKVIELTGFSKGFVISSLANLAVCFLFLLMMRSGPASGIGGHTSPEHSGIGHGH